MVFLLLLFSTLVVVVSQRSSNPKWMEQMVFEVKDRQCPLLVELVIGHSSNNNNRNNKYNNTNNNSNSTNVLSHRFDISSLTERSKSEHTFELKNEKLTASLVLQFLFLPSLVCPSRYRAQHCEPMRLWLERKDYYPSDAVKGFLLLSVNEQIKITEIQIECNAKVTLYYYLLFHLNSSYIIISIEIWNEKFFRRRTNGRRTVSKRRSCSAIRSICFRKAPKPTSRSFKAQNRFPAEPKR